MSSLGIFVVEFEKNIVKHPRIGLIGTFCKKTKMSKFRTKNVFFGDFCTRILEKLLLHLKPAPSNLSNCKILLKNENA